jgi:hypothetical protein
MFIIERMKPGLYDQVVVNDSPDICQVVWQALLSHQDEGWFLEQERIFLGTTHSLQVITSYFSEVVLAQPERKYKVTVRKSCINRQKIDQVAISLYLGRSNSTVDSHPRRTVFQCSWVCPKDMQDDVLIKQISTLHELLLDLTGKEVRLHFTEGFDDSSKPSSSS